MKSLLSAWRSCQLTTINRIALTEARLVLCKLLWNFDLQLEGNHDNWVDDARFYILWELQPLKVRLTPVKR